MIRRLQPEKKYMVEIGYLKYILGLNGKNGCKTPTHSAFFVFNGYYMTKL